MAGVQRHPIDFRSDEEALTFSGAKDCHLALLRKKLNLDINTRGRTLTLEGSETDVKHGIEICERRFGFLYVCRRAGRP